MGKNNKLELTWVDKEKISSIEPRVLIERTDLSNYNKYKDSDNLLIHGDNLLALKSLEQEYSGKIKCIYIDPPYNTGKAFNTYDDNVQHSIWLSLMRDRIVLLKKLLSDDGVFFVQINDDEYAYLKVLCDEIFGRDNYETTFYVKVRHENRILREDTRWQLCVEQVLCYRKTSSFIAPRRAKEKNALLDYKWEVETFGEPKEVINIGGYSVEIYDSSSWKYCKVNDGEGHFKQYQIRGSLITQKGSASEYYEYNLRSRREKDGLGTLYKVIGMGINGDGLGYRYIMQPEKPNSKNGFYFQGLPIKSKTDKGLPYPNFYDMTLPFNNVGYEGSGYFNGGKKPEEWIDFLLRLANIKPDEYVLDSFLGSGTTAAVCLKNGYKFIGVEMEDENAYNLCKPRLDMIINGQDDNGIDYKPSLIKGYRFCELAPSLIKEDDFGQTVINPEYNAEMLASAVAKHEGYFYNPDKTIFWKQSNNQGKSFLYVTTNHVNSHLIETIKADMQEDEFVLIVCKSFDSNCNSYKNIAIKKIPQSLLKNCEFGIDDYKLNIICPPEYDEED